MSIQKVSADNLQTFFTTMPIRSHPHPLSEKAAKTVAHGRKCHRRKNIDWCQPLVWPCGTSPAMGARPMIPESISKNLAKPNGDVEFSGPH